jgi:two-component system sensor histidine kinase ChvG
MTEGRTHLVRSLRVQALALLVILVALPILLYAIFANAQNQQRKLLVTAVRDAGTAIAAGLAPALRDVEPEQFSDLEGQLSRFADPRRRIVLLFHPHTESADTAFFLVASEPAIAVEQLDEERRRLASLRVLPALARSCAGGTPTAERVALQSWGAAVITSMTGVATKAGCWAIVIAVSSERVLAGIDDRPFYARPELQLALFVYGVMAGLILLLFGSVMTALRRFRRVALAPTAAGSFAAATVVPEIMPVARAIDTMVQRLHGTAETLRQAAEDNAHALKGPIATIRQAVEPLIGTAPTPQRLRTALAAMTASLDRLDGLIQSARRLDTATADLLEMAQTRVVLSALVRGLLADCRAMRAAQLVSIVDALEPNVVVLGEPEAIESIVENLLDNALSFSSPGGTVRVSLTAEGGEARLSVLDEGPGVPPAALSRIFDRYYSDRRAAPSGAEGAHFGIGLWIARQNARALGGEITASNRAPRGFCVRLSLPLALGGDTGLG